MENRMIIKDAMTGTAVMVFGKISKLSAGGENVCHCHRF